MKIAQKYLTQPIEQNFTAESWSQFEAYLNSLLSQLQQRGISEDQISLTFKGIEEYVTGFVEELRNDSKITFRQTMDLIEDLGTPSEIINELQPSIIQNNAPESSRSFCTECGSQIERDQVYCNHCGRNTTLPQRQFSPRKQLMIDRPYGFGFGVTFGSAILIGMIGFIIGIIGIFNGISISVSLDFGFAVLIIIILSIISTVIGWLIDEMYGEYKSFKQRYEQLESYFGSRRFLAHFMVVVSIMSYILGGIFYRDNLLGMAEGNVSAFFVTMVLPLYLLTISSTEDYPGSQEASFYQLLNLKSIISRKIVTLLYEFNKKTIMPLIIVSGVWHFVIFEQFAFDTAYAAIPGWFMFALLLLVINSLYYAHIHTWRFLKQYTT